MKTKEAREAAQAEIMDYVAMVLTHYQEQGDNHPQVCEEIMRQADRVAKLFGYEKAWHY
jgi:hypothetical protein